MLSNREFKYKWGLNKLINNLNFIENINGIRDKQRLLIYF